MTGLASSIADICRKTQREDTLRMLRSASLAVVPIVLLAFGARGQDRTVLLNGAWDCFNKQDYACAIRLASPCVAQFGRQAQRDQARIASGESPKPLPPGPTDQNSPEAKRTFANGVLNDAAACMFILGNAQERTSSCSTARRILRRLNQIDLRSRLGSEGLVLGARRGRRRWTGSTEGV